MLSIIPSGLNYIPIIHSIRGQKNSARLHLRSFVLFFVLPLLLTVTGQPNLELYGFHKPVYVAPSPAAAQVRARFNIDSDDWETTKINATQLIARELFDIPPSYINLTKGTWLFLDPSATCEAPPVGYVEKEQARRLIDDDVSDPRLAARLRREQEAEEEEEESSGNTGTIKGARASLPWEENVIPPEVPQWTNNAEFLDAIWSAEFCVSPYNTTLQYNGRLLPNIYLTGARDERNEFITADPARDILLEFHVVGEEWVNFAQIYNTRFVFEDDIPYPCLNRSTWITADIRIEIPETTPLCNETSLEWWVINDAGDLMDDIHLIDPHQQLKYIEWPEDFVHNLTEYMNTSFNVLGFKPNAASSQFREESLETGIAVCRDPLLEVRGCFELEFMVHEHPLVSEYKMDYLFNTARKLVFLERLHMLEENIRSVAVAPWDPSFTWVGIRPEVDEVSPWQVRHFPQAEWEEMEIACTVGVECKYPVPMAPSARFMQAGLIYDTWDFKEHAWPNLCSSVPECTESCLTDLTCLGGSDEYYSPLNPIKGNFWYRNPKFDNDDGESDVQLDFHSPSCPPDCCLDRKSCLRSHSVLGQRLEFNQPMMLIFGGKAYRHEMKEGRLIYHMCDELGPSDFDNHKEWRSCREQVVNELWSYDINKAQWLLIKPDSSTSITTNKIVGFPMPRFGHAVTLVIITKEKDPNQLRRQFLYVFGGMGPQCEKGLCVDLWRYEIPWASQSYYPRRLSIGDWDRGNKWYLLSSPTMCEGGCGRYLHSMVTSYDQDYIYAFGGQGMAEYFDTLFRYRVMTDVWETLDTRGYVSLQRLVYNHAGVPLKMNLPIEFFDPVVDGNLDPITAERCMECGARLGNRRDFPTTVRLPVERRDTAMVAYGNTSSLFLFGGYHTAWGVGERYDKSGPTEGRYNFSDVDPAAIQRKYYLDDTWIFQHEDSAWVELHQKESPKRRRGHVGAVRRPLSGDAQIFVFGGAFQDEPLDDLWVFHVQRKGEDREWTRIDTTYEGIRPDGRAYASLLYSETADTFFLFGGLGWKKTDVTETDKLRNADRRCKKYAKDLVSVVRNTEILASDNELNSNLYIITANDVEYMEMMQTFVLEKICKNDPQCEILLWIQRLESMWLSAAQFEAQDLLLFNFDAIAKKCDEICGDDVACENLFKNINRKEAAGFFETMQEACEAHNYCCDIYDEVIGEQQAFFAQVQAIGPDDPATVKAQLINSASLWFAEPLMVHDIINVRAIASASQWKCKREEFKEKFEPEMRTGVWTFSPNRCPRTKAGLCDGHGKCMLSHCICRAGRSGRDCSEPQCPGSMCYLHPVTHQSVCSHCSQRGRCIHGKCYCDEGWALEDCSAAQCMFNCTSTERVQRGRCIEEFPAHQCHCFEKYAGMYCEEIMCLNKCSGHGACVDGKCVCNPMYYGDDCSIFVFLASAGRIGVSFLLVLLVI